mgnify:CR=1 FL=1
MICMANLLQKVGVANLKGMTTRAKMEKQNLSLYIITWSKMVGVNLIAYTLHAKPQNISFNFWSFNFDRFIGSLFWSLKLHLALAKPKVWRNMYEICITEKILELVLEIRKGSKHIQNIAYNGWTK